MIFINDLNRARLVRIAGIGDPLFTYRTHLRKFTFRS